MNAALKRERVGKENARPLSCGGEIGDLNRGSPRRFARSASRSTVGDPLLRALMGLCAAMMGLHGVCSAKVLGVREPPTAMETVRLPQYCQWQFNRDKPQFQAPQFRINRVFPNCGVGTNHFCPGIVAINRANRPGADRDHRKYWTERARAEFQYTARAIKTYPDCGLHEPLRKYMNQVESMLKTLR